MKLQISMSAPARTALPTQTIDVTEEEWEQFKTGVGVGQRIITLGDNMFNADFVDHIKPITN